MKKSLIEKPEGFDHGDWVQIEVGKALTEIPQKMLDCIHLMRDEGMITNLNPRDIIQLALLGAIGNDYDFTVFKKEEAPEEVSD